MELLKEYWELLALLATVVATWVRGETKQKYLERRMETAETSIAYLKESTIRREEKQDTIIEGLKELKSSVKELLDRTARIEEREKK